MSVDYLILLAVTADVMFAAAACGASGIRIRPLSCLVMGCVSSGFVILSACGSGWLFDALPENTIRWIGCLALTAIGLWQILSGCFAEPLSRLEQHVPSGIRTLARLGHDAPAADSDGNKLLSPAEAFVLALPVSIDSLIAGLSITAAGFALIPLFAAGLLFGFVSVYLASRAAGRIPIQSERTRSLLCGLLLIGLGLAKRVL